MVRTWKGAVILTSHPVILEKLTNDFLHESTNATLEGFFSFRDFENPFALGTIPKFTDIEAWRYISLGRPILSGIEDFSKIRNEWEETLGDEWKIPLYLWVLTSYKSPDSDDFPKSKQELISMIFRRIIYSRFSIWSPI